MLLRPVIIPPPRIGRVTIYLSSVFTGEGLVRVYPPASVQPRSTVRVAVLPEGLFRVKYLQIGDTLLSSFLHCTKTVVASGSKGPILVLAFCEEILMVPEEQEAERQPRETWRGVYWCGSLTGLDSFYSFPLHLLPFIKSSIRQLLHLP